MSYNFKFYTGRWYKYLCSKVLIYLFFCCGKLMPLKLLKRKMSLKYIFVVSGVLLWKKLCKFSLITNVRKFLKIILDSIFYLFIEQRYILLRTLFVSIGVNCDVTFDFVKSTLKHCSIVGCVLFIKSEGQM
jgi:hypothetical protein